MAGLMSYPGYSLGGVVLIYRDTVGVILKPTGLQKVCVEKNEKVIIKNVYFLFGIKMKPYEIHNNSIFFNSVLIFVLKRSFKKFEYSFCHVLMNQNSFVVVNYSNCRFTSHLINDKVNSAKDAIPLII